MIAQRPLEGGRPHESVPEVGTGSRQGAVQLAVEGEGVLRPGGRVLNGQVEAVCLVGELGRGGGRAELEVVKLVATIEESPTTLWGGALVR